MQSALIVAQPVPHTRSQNDFPVQTRQSLLGGSALVNSDNVPTDRFLNVKGMAAVDVSPPLVCDHSRGESEDGLLM